MQLGQASILVHKIHVQNQVLLNLLDTLCCDEHYSEHLIGD